MSKIKKLLLDNRFYFVICALFFLLLEIHVIPIENTDDIVFANQLKEMGLFSFHPDGKDGYSQLGNALAVLCGAAKAVYAAVYRD